MRTAAGFQGPPSLPHADRDIYTKHLPEHVTEAVNTLNQLDTRLQEAHSTLAQAEQALKQAEGNHAAEQVRGLLADPTSPLPSTTDTLDAAKAARDEAEADTILLKAAKGEARQRGWQAVGGDDIPRDTLITALRTRAAEALDAARAAHHQAVTDLGRAEALAHAAAQWSSWPSLPTNHQRAVDQRDRSIRLFQEAVDVTDRSIHRDEATGPVLTKTESSFEGQDEHGRPTRAAKRRAVTKAAAAKKQ